MPTENRITLTPDTPVRYLKGVGPKTAERFEKLGIVTLADLLCHYPRKYIDFTKPYSIAEAPADMECVVKAEVFAKPGGRILPGGRRMERVTAGDDVSGLEITWFNNPYAAQKLEIGQEYYFQGIVTGGMLRRQMVNPLVRTAEQVQAAPFEAVYPQTEGLSSSAIAKCVRQLLPHAELLPDPLPEEMRRKYRLPSKAEAVRAIHRPATEEEAFAARRRLIYEELLVLQLGIGRMKNRGSAATGAPMQPTDPEPFWASLPFSPTGAQRRAVDEILADMAGEHSMNRLLQGDVGSGKTMVAAAACFCAIQNGHQAAFMAPTEILAEQHAQSLSRLFSPLGIHVTLLTGSMTAAQKRAAKSAITSGAAQLIIGTHALFTRELQFHDLALVVCDEQHRFGVAQRAALSAKGNTPHLLVMSATPIPRTLALIAYGDLDVSVISELPPGRLPVETFLIGEDKRKRLNTFIDKQCDAGHQVYIVCPAVEQSELEDLKSAEGWAQALGQAVFPHRRVGLLHGKMKQADKDAALGAFSRGETDILVATTVVEVGVDVPNATLMVIENADRFGLSQLHQLRGRVGRGSAQSYCILVSSNRNEQTRKRLKALCATTDGFQIAEEDLALRGPGDFLGQRQHGLPLFKVADLQMDMQTLMEAKQAAGAAMTGPETLELAAYAPLRARVDALFRQSDLALN